MHEVEETGHVPEHVKARAYMNHALGMVTFLVGAAWFAMIDLLFGYLGVPSASLGYLLAAVGITVPVWLL